MKKYVGDKHADMFMALTHQEWVKALICIVSYWNILWPDLHFCKIDPDTNRVRVCFKWKEEPF